MRQATTRSKIFGRAHFFVTGRVLAVGRWATAPIPLHAFPGVRRHAGDACGRQIASYAIWLGGDPRSHAITGIVLQTKWRCFKGSTTSPRFLKRK
jgi:hypothetical protein